ncbi:hypothetical protein [Stagnihabitans tardus]|nr:hypothetical protein [Stagnihabitans tardus]
MIARIVRFTRQPDPSLAALEDALGVVSLFVLLFLGLTLSGSI